MQTVSVSEAKDKLSSLVESVESTHDAVVITRHGKPAAVLISPEDLDSLQDTLAWLSNPNHAAEIAEAEDDIAHGRMLSREEVRAQLAKRLPSSLTGSKCLGPPPGGSAPAMWGSPTAFSCVSTRTPDSCWSCDSPTVPTCSARASAGRIRPRPSPTRREEAPGGDGIRTRMSRRRPQAARWARCSVRFSQPPPRAATAVCPSSLSDVGHVSAWPSSASQI